MVYMLVGIQGSGKSTFAKNFLKENGGVLISTDEVRKNNPGIEESSVWPIIYASIAESIKNNIDVIYDATNITQKVRKRFFDEVEKYGVKVECGAFYFDTDVKTCIERVAIRNQIEGELPLPLDVITNYSKSLVLPTINEGFKFVKRIVNGVIDE